MSIYGTNMVQITRTSKQENKKRPLQKRSFFVIPDLIGDQIASQAGNDVLFNGVLY